MLVVEDDPINQLVAEGLLAALGFEVDLAVDGEEAIAAVAARAYGAVLMDAQMPVKDGYQATAEIRSREAGPRLPIIAMTASATEEDQRRATAAGMDGFVAKPVDAAALDRVLSRWLPVVPAHEAAPAEETAPPDEAVIPDLGPALDMERVALLRGLGSASGGGLLPTLVDAFAESAPALTRSIGAAADRQDWPTVRTEAHQLAGAAGNIGALAAATLARSIERHVADAGEVPGEVCARLAAEVDRAVDLLARTLQRAG